MKFVTLSNNTWESSKTYSLKHTIRSDSPKLPRRRGSFTLDGNSIGWKTAIEYMQGEQNG